MQQYIEKLREYRSRKKFTQIEWEQRGLIPSEVNVILQLIHIMNSHVDTIIKGLEGGARKHEIEKTLKDQINSVGQHAFDTEETEFLVDYLYELAELVEIDIADKYQGSMFDQLEEMFNQFGKTQSDTNRPLQISQPCNQCETPLISTITRASSKSDISAYFIVTCHECGHHNAIYVDDEIKAFFFGNYTFVEQHDAKKISKTQVQIRVNELNS